MKESEARKKQCRVAGVLFIQNHKGPNGVEMPTAVFGTCIASDCGHWNPDPLLDASGQPSGSCGLKR